MLLAYLLRRCSNVSRCYEKSIITISIHHLALVGGAKSLIFYSHMILTFQMKFLIFSKNLTAPYITHLRERLSASYYFLYEIIIGIIIEKYFPSPEITYPFFFSFFYEFFIR
jgi:hypothetical protein